MPLLILVLILAVPYLEFLVFLEVGEAIGGLNALIATLLTAVLGVYLIRLEGFEVMRRMHDNLQRGESPVEEIFHGFFLLIAGFFFPASRIYHGYGSGFFIHKPDTHPAGTIFAAPCEAALLWPADRSL